MLQSESISSQESTCLCVVHDVYSNTIQINSIPHVFCLTIETKATSPFFKPQDPRLCCFESCYTYVLLEKQLSELFLGFAIQQQNETTD